MGTVILILASAPASLLVQGKELIWQETISFPVRMIFCLLHSLNLLKKTGRVLLTRVLSARADSRGRSEDVWPETGEPLMAAPQLY